MHPSQQQQQQQQQSTHDNKEGTLGSSFTSVARYVLNIEAEIYITRNSVSLCLSLSPYSSKDMNASITTTTTTTTIHSTTRGHSVHHPLLQYDIYSMIEAEIYRNSVSLCVSLSPYSSKDMNASITTTTTTTTIHTRQQGDTRFILYFSKIST
jgi:hypothetical protein